MADQQSLNQLLQWGIENSDTPQQNSATASHQPRDTARGLDASALAALLGGPSDADLMKSSMSAILAPISAVSLSEKLVAWDNLEQLIEQIDNANNIEPLGLWKPLLSQLTPPSSTANGDTAASIPPEDDARSSPESRAMAAWCVSTAVQNNVKSQTALLAHDGVTLLARVATSDSDAGVRKKAISALSSSTRNFQSGLDALVGGLQSDTRLAARDGGSLLLENVRKSGADAADMESVDTIIHALREFSARL